LARKTRNGGFCILVCHHCDYAKNAGTNPPVCRSTFAQQGVSLGMATREDYLRHAAECVALARTAEDSDAKARLLEMAQAWRALADKADPTKLMGKP
jgi:primosomal protein N'